MINLVARFKPNDLRLMPFEKAIQELDYLRGEGMMNAIQLFTGLNAVEVYCPIMSKEKDGTLLMTWSEGKTILRIWIKRNIRVVKYAIGDYGKLLPTASIDISVALTLIEEWGEFLTREFRDGKKAEASKSIGS